MADEELLVSLFAPSRRQDHDENNLAYDNLSEHVFSPAERFWICAELEKQDNRIGYQGGSYSEFCKRYQLCPKTVKQWRHRFKHHIHYSGTKGRKRAIDEKGEENIRHSLANHYQNKRIHQDSFEDILRREAEETCKRRRIDLSNTAVNGPSRNTTESYKKALDVKVLTPQATTKARYYAQRDIRNGVSTAVAMMALAGHLPAAHKWNSDGTTIKIDESGTEGGVEIVFLDERGNSCPPPEQRDLDYIDAPNSPCIFIRFAHLHVSTV